MVKKELNLIEVVSRVELRCKATSRSLPADHVPGRFGEILASLLILSRDY